VSDYPVLKPGPKFNQEGMRVRYGGCSCGAVRFEVTGEPLKIGTCHCMECRKATGAAFVYYADWPESAFALQGEAREYRGRSFCPICGSRLFHLSKGQVEIMLGSLDDGPSDLRPSREGWIIRREKWLAPIASADQFDRDPE
jgi:hypothetical protein